MEKIINFVKKYKVYILAGLFVIYFFKSCGRGRTISKFERSQKGNIELIDSLTHIVKNQELQIEEFPSIIKREKMLIYLSLDDTISRVDRSPQLMSLHKMIKDSVRSLQK